MDAYDFHLSLASWASTYSTSMQGVVRPIFWDRGPYYIMDDADYQEVDMKGYKHVKCGITSMADLHRNTVLRQLPSTLLMDEEHTDPSAYLGLLQWTVRLSTIAMAMSWEDTFFQSWRDNKPKSFSDQHQLVGHGNGRDSKHAFHHHTRLHDFAFGCGCTHH